MVRYLSLVEVLYIHTRQLQDTGGGAGIRDPGALESALAQPQMTFDGSDLYPTLKEKAAALGFSIIQNHPFVDGNKRTGFAAMSLFLRKNGYRIQAPVDGAEQMVLAVASGQAGREGLLEWLEEYVMKGDKG